MKKLIRLFIAIFCIFFALQAMPGVFFPVFRSFARKSGQVISEMTLLLAEKIDEATGGGAGPSQTGSGQEGAGGAQDPDAPKKAETSGHTDSSGKSGESGDSQNPQDPEHRTDSGDPQDEGRSPDSGETLSAQTGSDKNSSGNGESTEDSADGEKTEDPDIDLYCYYYTKISKEERLLYDAMLSLAQNPKAWQGEEEIRLMGMDPSSEEFAESYTRAYNALVNDHPELFWIAQARAKFECRYYLLPSFGGRYKIMLSLVPGSGQTAQDSDGQGAEALFQAFREEQKQLEAAVDDLLGQVDLTRSDAVVALRLHDLLVEKAWYNTTAGADDYAHTAYGALVEDSSGNPGGALCDGYSLAYEYLLQHVGIPCIMVCGYAGSSEADTEKHAWNLVQLDGEWYEVDATWNDLDFELSPDEEGYDLLLEALSDEEYMRRIRHYMFNRTTEQMRSFQPGEEYRYTSYNGWVTLLQPSVHIRFSEDDSDWTRDFVTPLAPEAEGTWYTWDTLEGLSPQYSASRDNR